MSGLRHICKQYGSIVINGVEWVWDYANDRPRVKSEMTKEEIEHSNQFKHNDPTHRKNTRTAHERQLLSCRPATHRQETERRSVVNSNH